VEHYHRLLQELLSLSGATVEERARSGLDIVLQVFQTIGASQGLVRLCDYLLRLRPSESLRLEILSWDARFCATMDPHEAQRKIREVEKKIRGSKVTPGVRLSLAIARSHAFFREGELEQSLKESRKALVLAKSIGDLREEAIAIYREAVSLSRLNRLEEVEKVSTQFLKVAKKIDEPKNWTMYSMLAHAVALQKGDLVRAQRAMESDLPRTRDYGNYIGFTSELINLANVLILRGDLDEAGCRLNEAYGLSEKIGHYLGVGAVTVMKGSLNLARGLPNEARSEIHQALKLFAEYGHQEMNVRCQLDLAEVSLHKGEAAAALDELAAHDTRTDLTMEEVHRRAILLAWAYEMLGDARRSRRYLRDALAVSRGASDRLAEAEVKLSLSHWESSHGSPKRGGNLRREAQDLFDRCGVRPGGWIRSWPPLEGIRVGSRTS
jgi:ATP/maltotriose-dependent transcriptional regulator MalT